METFEVLEWKIPLQLLCVRVHVCVRQRSWWVSNKRLHQSEEWAAKPDLSFDLPWRAMDGWMDRWGGWMEGDVTERNRESIYWSAVQRLLSSSPVKAALQSARRQSLIFQLRSHSHDLEHHQYTGNDQGNDAADMMDKEHTHGDCCFWHCTSHISSPVDVLGGGGLLKVQYMDER